VDGVVQPAVAPRFSRTVPPAPTLPRDVSPANNLDALTKWLDAEVVAGLRSRGVVA
jgi:alpha-methylacyl-CoA racemase